MATRVTSKKPLTGNRRSHALNATKMKQKPNLQKKTINGEKVIMFNAKCAILRYTRRVEKETFFSPEFAAALALYLAADAGKAITGSQQKADDAMKRYWDKVRLGQIANASEGQEVDEDKTTYLDVR